MIFFDLGLKILEVYKRWYDKNINQNLGFDITKLKELNEIYFLCKCLEYFYKSDYFLTNNINVKRLKEITTKILCSCERNNLAYKVCLAEIKSFLRKHIFSVMI